MKPIFSLEEEKLIAHAQEQIVRYNQMRHQRGGIDTLYAFLITDSGKIFDGASFEPKLTHATVCAERQAIANMVLQESYAARIKAIVIADPVPSIQPSSTPPCGTCRHLVWEFGTPETAVILMQYIQTKRGWTFPKLEKFKVTEFYPYPYDPKEGLWDTWSPA